MTNFYFSPSTLSFYPNELIASYKTAGSLPDDIIAVSDETFVTYSGTPPQGKMRGATKERKPTWVDFPPLSYEEEVEVADAEKQAYIDHANDYMNSKQWPGKAALGRLTDTEKEQYNQWLDYLDALEAVDTSSAPDINWPESPEE